MNILFEIQQALDFVSSKGIELSLIEVSAKDYAAICNSMEAKSDNIAPNAVIKIFGVTVEPKEDVEENDFYIS